MTLNVDYQQLSTDDKVELKGKIRDVLAESASVDPAAVSVTLTPGSVKVVAEIQTPDVNSAKSIENAMSKNNIAENVMEAANSIPGVKAAATGELKVTGLEVKTAPALSDADSAAPSTTVSTTVSTSNFMETSSETQQATNSGMKITGSPKVIAFIFLAMRFARGL